MKVCLITIFVLFFIVNSILVNAQNEIFAEITKQGLKFVNPEIAEALSIIEGLLDPSGFIVAYVTDKLLEQVGDDRAKKAIELFNNLKYIDAKSTDLKVNDKGEIISGSFKLKDKKIEANYIKVSSEDGITAFSGVEGKKSKIRVDNIEYSLENDEVVKVNKQGGIVAGTKATVEARKGTTIKIDNEELVKVTNRWQMVVGEEDVTLEAKEDGEIAGKKVRKGSRYVYEKKNKEIEEAEILTVKDEVYGFDDKKIKSVTDGQIGYKSDGSFVLKKGGQYGLENYQLEVDAETEDVNLDFRNQECTSNCISIDSEGGWMNGNGFNARFIGTNYFNVYPQTLLAFEPVGGEIHFGKGEIDIFTDVDEEVRIINGRNIFRQYTTAEKTFLDVATEDVSEKSPYFRKGIVSEMRHYGSDKTKILYKTKTFYGMLFDKYIEFKSGNCLNQECYYTSQLAAANRIKIESKIEKDVLIGTIKSELPVDDIGRAQSKIKDGFDELAQISKGILNERYSSSLSVEELNGIQNALDSIKNKIIEEGTRIYGEEVQIINIETIIEKEGIRIINHEKKREAFISFKEFLEEGAYTEIIYQCFIDASKKRIIKDLKE